MVETQGKLVFASLPGFLNWSSSNRRAASVSCTARSFSIRAASFWTRYSYNWIRAAFCGLDRAKTKKLSLTKEIKDPRRTWMTMHSFIFSRNVSFNVFFVAELSHLNNATVITIYFETWVNKIKLGRCQNATELKHLATTMSSCSIFLSSHLSDCEALFPLNVFYR